ncbi:tyrosine-protein phosphatase [Rhabdaerophilum sp. SD176]|uniref:phosphatase domain-containing protein n=1 Tax=Rhabdaerophilum sp. SD176 TaxID=2983548 RepID=UPI0024E01E15|nr:tyrosine-protein phosphatase [Rhabdaerophilum sp. SD176]
MPLPGRTGIPASDLAVIRAWRPGLLISLVEPEEWASLGLAALPAELATTADTLIAFPIPDYGTPEPGGRSAAMLETACATLRQGGSVLVHCHGGRGRSGMMAARLLVMAGATPDEAIHLVRAARPGAIETAAQEAWTATGG